MEPFTVKTDDQSLEIVKVGDSGSEPGSGEGVGGGHRCHDDFAGEVDFKMVVAGREGLRIPATFFDEPKKKG